MAGFFSLGGRGAGPHSNKEEEEERVVEKHHHHHHNNSSLFLFRNNDEVYNNKGGFEIWPQPYHQNQGLSNYYSFGVGPSSRRNNNNNNNDNSNNNSNEEDVSFCVSDESTRFGLTVMRSSSGGGGTASGGVNCQDCGNQAKKDCAHLRCRTCCKSRGFQCQTHVKSTWVPAAKRRERQQQLAALQQQQLRSDTCSKRHRDNQQALIDTLPCPPHVPTITTTGLELGQFPSEVSSSAVFRCVKVSAIDSPDEQYAYQTAVNIGGHLFKGILYDQGPQGPYTTAIVAEGSSAGGGGGTETHHQQQQLSLITASTTAATGNHFDPSSSSLYPAPLNAFMAGTQFFPPPRS